MFKNLPIRYVSEESVKGALKIDSFRNLSKDKIMQFASMIPYMDKEVAIAIINQFPTFVEFGNTLISNYTQLCNNILENNKESQAAVIHGYQTILDSLAKRMNEETISDEERNSITKDMISVADKIAKVDLQNKKFLYKFATRVACASVGFFAIVGATLGIRSYFAGNDDLPQLNSDDEYDNDDEDIEDMI